MPGLKHLAVIVLALTINLPALAGSDMEDKKESEMEVKQVVAVFYKALNAMFTGDLDPMKEIWSHADDVTYMGPDGSFQVGWDQVLANWQWQADKKLGGKVKPGEMTITAGQDIAIVNHYVTGENTPADGKSEKVSLRATLLFRKEDGKWKMLGLHSDTLPFLEKGMR